MGIMSLRGQPVLRLDTRTVDSARFLLISAFLELSISVAVSLAGLHMNVNVTFCLIDCLIQCWHQTVRRNASLALDELTDAELVALCQASLPNDTRAYREFLRRYEQRVFGTCNRTSCAISSAVAPACWLSKRNYQV